MKWSRERINKSEGKSSTCSDLSFIVARSKSLTCSKWSAYSVNKFAFNINIKLLEYKRDGGILLNESSYEKPLTLWEMCENESIVLLILNNLYALSCNKYSSCIVNNPMFRCIVKLQRILSRGGLMILSWLKMYWSWVYSVRSCSDFKGFPVSFKNI